MPNHDYKCSDHGMHERFVKLGAAVPSWSRCPAHRCGRKSPWVPPTVAVIWKCPK